MQICPQKQIKNIYQYPIQPPKSNQDKPPQTPLHHKKGYGKYS